MPNTQIIDLNTIPVFDSLHLGVNGAVWNVKSSGAKWFMLFFSKNKFKVRFNKKWSSCFILPRVSYSPVLPYTDKLCFNSAFFCCEIKNLVMLTPNRSQKSTNWPILHLINRKFRVSRKQGAHFLGARAQIQDSWVFSSSV
jgi:hypothetical protein